MPANELSAAVAPVVELLRRTNLQALVSEYRAGLVSGRFADIGEKLRIAGQEFVDAYQNFSEAELKVCRILHLEDLGKRGFWQRVCTAAEGPERTRAEVVTLYSRVMFANNHLPSLVQLFGADGAAASASVPVVAKTPARTVRPGGAELKVRLLDAGESASDPDRISRTIDGIEMLYTGCCGISRKGEINLSLISVDGTDGEKFLTFEGDRDEVTAVIAVVESIAEEIASVEDIEHCDPEQLVLQLPVFEDLNTLQSVHKVSAEESAEIAGTLREGALLVMESGVLLVRPEKPRIASSKPTVVPLHRTEEAGQQRAAAPVVTEVKPTVKLKSGTNSTTAERAESAEADVDDMSPDEFYQHYLKEKDRIQGKADTSSEAQQVAGTSQNDLAEGSSKTDALSDLLADLDRINRK
ncbi:hypothetical protein Q4485_03970 [Granulosicoccaceae sp. 1_MG-2023]|nr:hypothetical protein [Granulosicoccaceae sp. 1_MG-2023]